MVAQALAALLLGQAVPELPDQRVSMEESSDDERAIRDQARRFSAAYVTGDLAGMLASYCPGAVIAPPRRDFLTGDAITRYWHPRQGFTVTSHVLEPVSIEVHGDIAVDHGFYSGAQGPDGKVASFRGKYLVVWQRQSDGSWCMQQDMWNAADE